MAKTVTSVLPIILAMAASAGCNKVEEVNPATQVAARVNAKEITIHQVNDMLARLKVDSTDEAEKAKAAILERLVDQELAKQQAIGMNLDRTPKVVRAIEFSRSEILSRAFLDQIISTLPKPSPEEIKEYYAKHPELFSNRRIFDVEELVIHTDQKSIPSLKGEISKIHSLEAIAEWLKSKNMNFMANRGVRSAEQIPMASLPKLQSMGDGQIGVFESDGGLEVIRIVSSRIVPVDESSASIFIQRYLANRRSGEAVARKSQELREKATIEYFGEFSGKPIGRPATVFDATTPAATADPAKQFKIEDLRRN